MVNWILTFIMGIGLAMVFSWLALPLIPENNPVLIILTGGAMGVLGMRLAMMSHKYLWGNR